MLRQQMASTIRACRGPAPFRPHLARSGVTMRSAQPNQAAVEEAYAKAMQDPAMASKLKAMQEAMSRPEVQQQMQQMQSVMGNPQLQARMQQLRNDPEFVSFFEDIKTGGMQALMKYYNDPAFLAKLNSRVGDVVPSAVASAQQGVPPGAVPSAPAAPEVKDLLDAAKYGDEEAVEDFIAIGKDVGMADKEGRTPLHYAAGYNHAQIARLLLSENAPLEATDSKGNTPLHYAAGYGRPDLVEVLLEAGANKSAVNANGSTPYALATADARNPLSSNQEVLAKLKV